MSVKSKNGARKMSRKFGAYFICISKKIFKIRKCKNLSSTSLVLSCNHLKKLICSKIFLCFWQLRINKRRRHGEPEIIFLSEIRLMTKEYFSQRYTKIFSWFYDDTLYPDKDDRTGLFNYAYGIIVVFCFISVLSSTIATILLTMPYINDRNF